MALVYFGKGYLRHRPIQVLARVYYIPGLGSAFSFPWGKETIYLRFSEHDSWRALNVLKGGHYGAN